MAGIKKRTTTITRIMALIFALISTLNIKAQDIVYEKGDSVFIENITRKHPIEKYNNTGKRIVALAKEFIGKKYVAGTLDGYTDEPLLISCSKLDCTTFVELVLAIAISKEGKFSNTCDALEQIRYRNGIRNGYTSRLHYISWWITDSAKQEIITEITTSLHTDIQALDLNYMSTHPESYRHLQDNTPDIRYIANMEMPYRGIEIKYIPNQNVKNIKKDEIKEGDIIAIVTSIEGLDTSHIGFAHWHSNELHIIHASSIAGKIIDDQTPLHEYLSKRKNHLGIRVFRAL